MQAALLCFLPVALALATFTEKDYCNRQCGDMTVPFPFGLNEDCAWSPDLVLWCNHTSGILNLGKNIPVYNISLVSGTMTVGLYRAFDCYNESGSMLDSSKPDLSITLGQQYTLSDTRNKLTVFGCDTSARMSDAAGTFGSGCFSYCREDINFTTESACSGLGCFRSFSSCGSAFVVDQETFNVSNYKLPVPPDMQKEVYSNAVLDWVVQRNLTCKEAQSNRSIYACGGANSICSDFKNGQGYLCFCKHGYTGNPYASPGCQDIDECKYPRQYPCHGNCKNTLGNYTCNCPFGMTGDGKVGCQISRLAIVAAVIDKWRRTRKQKNFRRNGGQLLKHQRVQIFTEVELAKATNNYDDSNKLGEGGFGSIYKGEIAGGTMVAVKKPKDVHKSLIKGDFQQELEIVMQINHKNVVKLHGICLETRIPLLVYEYISNGTLSQHIHRNTSTILRSWKNRLRIATEAALALEYMHSCAEPPIIRGDIKSVNILLDQNYSVKVSDFGTSVLISPEHSHVLANEIQDTWGYIDPEYLVTG
ncbi:hypothetical protein EUGRSUZ_E03946 [Eucalyptus grandis]|uniref:Uncharacterized protein n=2 Tax=Eucalyptus grandis TaxID=71139 RepID=A0ACC3L107_EUCGR|nr:hypothetical protein EUGRSUZ_E03946 [Eucalyptus grandis]